MSAKRRMDAFVSGRPRISATASARGRLLLQATIFMNSLPKKDTEPVGTPETRGF
jgi:hypothetical protein